MDLKKFSKIAESLRQYRRAELKDFEKEIGNKPVDVLYVDPLPGGAVLNSVLSSNTTFLMGRKGTGKSTIFAKAQSSLRNSKDLISIYIDVNRVYDILSTTEVPIVSIDGKEIDPSIYRAHMLRKITLGQVIAELLKEINTACDNFSIIERWLGAKRQYEDIKENLKKLEKRSVNTKLESHELPILQKISTQLKIKEQTEASKSASAKVGGKITPISAEASAEASLSDFDKTLDDSEIYNEYSDVVLKSFPFNEIFDEIKDLLSEAGLTRIVIFFDDFSELRFLDQRLFVDVILSPLNNSSNESIKLKIAGYPGRVYYGKIDPSKVDTIILDFSELYEATEVQEMERSAISYTTRLLHTRFKAFKTPIENYFEIDSSYSIEDYMSLIFQASFNVPRIMGHLLHYCFLDRVSKGQQITFASLKLATRKYYDQTIKQYFDRMNRFALEPFENKLDRHNQKQLLDVLIKEIRSVRKRIIDRSVGGTYFNELTNPPTSHFTVTPSLENIFISLESNFLLSKYKNTRDKNGAPVCVYAFYFGLCESERMTWGYPSGRQYRNYFVQRCFDLSRAVHEYLSLNQTIRCERCGQCYPLDKKSSFEMFKWRCPECNEGHCAIANLSEDFKGEVEKLDREIMLEPVELDILSTLSSEGRKMRAGEISALIDKSYQLVGKRTGKLNDLGLVEKGRDKKDSKTKSKITDRAINTYFS
jgi:hypothetical protein